MPVCNATGVKCTKLQTIFSLLSTKTVQKLQIIFQTLMKATTVLINANKNCLQDIFCVRDYVAVSRRFCHGYCHMYHMQIILENFHGNWINNLFTGAQKYSNTLRSVNGISCYSILMLLNCNKCDETNIHFSNVKKQVTHRIWHEQNSQSTGPHKKNSDVIVTIARN